MIARYRCLDCGWCWYHNGKWILKAFGVLLAWWHAIVTCPYKKKEK